MNKSMSTINRVYGASNIIFGLETSTSSEQFTATLNKPANTKLANVITSDSQNIINNSSSNVDVNTIIYINTNKQLEGTFVNGTTVTFASGWLTAPTGLPATSVDNFIFFCNGQLIEKSAIVSFTESSGISTLVINASLLGFSFDATDEIIAIGKFQ
jgi:hypothetical protein